MKSDEIRRENARYLARTVGGLKEFATHIDRDPTYVSQVIGKTPSRGIGPAVARHIEKCFTKPEGWLDSPQGVALLPNVSSVTQGPLTLVPVISYVQAGKMSEAVDPYSLGDSFASITTDGIVSGSTFALEIRDTSMEPDFREGDRIIVDPAVPPSPGDFVVAKNCSAEATFKKYRPRSTGPNGSLIFELVPLNSDYPTLRSDADDLQIIGTMVEHRRYRRR